jgi:aminopeptidase N
MVISRHSFAFIGFLLFLTLIFTPLTVANAGLPFSLQTTPGELPKDVVPHKYEIFINTDMKRLSFTGSESITIDIVKPTNKIVINDLGLIIGNVKLTGGETPIRTKIDTSAQTATFTYAKQLAIGVRNISMQFAGQMQAATYGLFYVPYKIGSKTETLISTQFESTDARRMFPGWDEPAFRAVFRLTIQVPQDFVAISNTPISSVSKGKSGYKTVSFEETPPMPSYLLELSAGKFGSVSGTAAGVPVHIYTTLDKVNQGRFSLAVVQQILPYYNDYYGIKYPLKKLDLIALPGGFDGGMENWGAITFNDSSVLYDPKTEPEHDKEEVYSIIAHETAHQWTGDLVTTAWWDDIWLNEGFANWMDVKAAQKFHPEWHPWVDANNDNYDVMTEDDIVGSHPVHQVLTDPLQVSAAFDDLTYEKGQSVIRMIETYLGEPTFEAGMKYYIRQQKYSNATSTDLWNALSQVSGKPMDKIAGPWIDTPGFPVVTVDTVGAGPTRVLCLSQERYFANSPVKSAQLWEIPIRLQQVGHSKITAYLMTGRTAEVPYPGTDPILLNAGNDGYFRVHYDATMWSSISSVSATLQPADQIALISDRWALVQTEQVPISSYLDLISRFSGQSGIDLLHQMESGINYIGSLEVGTPGNENFHEYIDEFGGPLLHKIGLAPVRGEGRDIDELRPDLFRYLGLAGDQTTIAESREMFAVYLKSPASVPVSLIGPMLETVGRWADQATYDQLHQAGLRTSDLTQKLRYYRAMCCSIDPNLAQESLALCLSKELPDPYNAYLLLDVAHYGEQPQLAWDFYTANTSAVNAQLDSYSVPTFPMELMADFHDDTHADEFAAYGAQHLPKDLSSLLSATLEKIRQDARFSRDNLPEADAWFNSKLTSAPTTMAVQ